MLVIPLIRRNDFASQPTAPGRPGGNFRNMPAQDNRQSGEGKANRYIFLYLIRAIRYRQVDFQVCIFIVIVQLRHDTKVRQMDIRNGKERHFTGYTSQLMCRILSQAP